MPKKRRNSTGSATTSPAPATPPSPAPAGPARGQGTATTVLADPAPLLALVERVEAAGKRDADLMRQNAELTRQMTELARTVAELRSARPTDAKPASEKGGSAKAASSGAQTAEAPKAPASRPTADATKRLATIKQGETLACAAQRLGVRLERIYELNPGLETVPPDMRVTEGDVWIPNDL